MVGAVMSAAGTNADFALLLRDLHTCITQGVPRARLLWYVETMQRLNGGALARIGGWVTDDDIPAEHTPPRDRFSGFSGLCRWLSEKGSW